MRPLIEIFAQVIETLAQRLEGITGSSRDMTIFIVNPKRPFGGYSDYYYRQGLSLQEIEFISHNFSLMHNLIQVNILSLNDRGILQTNKVFILFSIA